MTATWPTTAPDPLPNALPAGVEYGAYRIVATAKLLGSRYVNNVRDLFRDRTVSIGGTMAHTSDVAWPSYYTIVAACDHDFADPELVECTKCFAHRKVIAWLAGEMMPATYVPQVGDTVRILGIPGVDRFDDQEVTVVRAFRDTDGDISLTFDTMKRGRAVARYEFLGCRVELVRAAKDSCVPAYRGQTPSVGGPSGGDKGTGEAAGQNSRSGPAASSGFQPRKMCVECGQLPSERTGVGLTLSSCGKRLYGLCADCKRDESWCDLQHGTPGFVPLDTRITDAQKPTPPEKPHPWSCDDVDYVIGGA